MGAEPPETDPPQSFDIDDHELDQLIADWEAVDRQVAHALREALDEHRGAGIPDGDPVPIRSRIREGLATGVYPFDWIGRAAGLDREPPPDDGTELLLRCVAATISPREQLDLEVELLALLDDVAYPEAVQPDEPAKLIVHPLFLLAPRSSTTQSLGRAADVFIRASTPLFQQDPPFQPAEVVHFSTGVDTGAFLRVPPRTEIRAGAEPWFRRTRSPSSSSRAALRMGEIGRDICANRLLVCTEPEILEQPGIEAVVRASFAASACRTRRFSCGKEGGRRRAAAGPMLS